MSDISRSEYQKVVEENKRLKADIYQLVLHGKEYNEVKQRWRKTIEDEDALTQAMREFFQL